MSQAAVAYQTQPAGRTVAGWPATVAAESTATAYQPWPTDGQADTSRLGVVPEQPAADEAITALAGAVGRVGAVRLNGLWPKQLLAHAVALDRQITRLEAARAKVLAAVDTSEAYREEACLSTTSWWRFATRRDFGAARRDVVVGRRAPTLTATEEAWAAGDITTAHATAIVEAATPSRHPHIAAAEETLVALARQREPRAVRRALRVIADTVDEDGTEQPPSNNTDEQGRDTRRGLWHSNSFDGLAETRITSDAVTSERLRNLLHALSEPDPPDTPLAQQRTAAQKRFDAFAKILEAAEEHPDLPSVHGAKPHVLVTIDLLTLLGNQAVATRNTRLGSGEEIDLATALRLVEDAKLTPVLMLGPYRAVGVGRTQRVLPAWLRNILQLIHEHCRGPGCDRPIAWTQAAHLNAWDAGGDTDLDETIPGCDGHHYLMDTVGWNVELDPDTAICTWTSPDGKTILTTHPPDP